MNGKPVPWDLLPSVTYSMALQVAQLGIYCTNNEEKILKFLNNFKLEIFLQLHYSWGMR
jgi:hypothetical protein